MRIKTLICAAGIFIGATIITSCLDEDTYEIDYNLQSSIRSFSISTMKIDRVGKDKNGQDSAYVDTIYCGHYPFSIDQLGRKIENKDSLPVGTHIDKVLTQIKADTEIITYKKKNYKGEELDTVWTSTDSIDFTNPVRIKVFSYTPNEFENKLYEGKEYVVKINVHRQEPDSLQWTKYGESYISGNGFGCVMSKQKALYAHDKVFVFGLSENVPVVKYATVLDNSLDSWNTLDISSLTNVDLNSAILFMGEIYFRANNVIYKVGADGSFAEDQSSAIAGLYNSFPASDKVLTAVSNPLSYNESLSRTLLLGENAGTLASDTTAVVWQKLSNEEQWLQIVQNNPNTCPNLKNISMVSYDGRLLAFGGNSANGKVKAFDAFYYSTDNGLTWHEETKNMSFPKIFQTQYTEQSSHSTFVDLNKTSGKDNCLWVIWSDGTFSKGRINRLGFKPKEW